LNYLNNLIFDLNHPLKLKNFAILSSVLFYIKKKYTQIFLTFFNINFEEGNLPPFPSSFNINTKGEKSAAVSII